MNILLTDIQSSNPGLQAMPVEAPAETPEFSGLLHQQLSGDGEPEVQVIEIKADYSDIPGMAEIGGEIMVAPPVEAWSDFLVRRQVGMKLEAGTSGTVPAEILLSAEAVLPTAAQLGDRPKTMGDGLPAAGNLLPLDAPTTASLPIAGGEAEIPAAMAHIASADPSAAVSAQIARPDARAAVPVSTPGNSVILPELKSAPASAGTGEPSGVAISTALNPVAAVAAQGERKLKVESETGTRVFAADLSPDDAADASTPAPTRELMLKEVFGARFVESQPQTQAVSSSQPMLTSAGQSVQAPLTLHNPLAPQSIPLPQQLDNMSLSLQGDKAEWGNGLAERVGWMINQKQNSASIRLDPPMLGKLDVQVKVADEATTITIQTQHAQTRDLIESASSRLRDFLQENGYQNVNVDVSQQQNQQQAQTHSDSESGGQADEASQHSASSGEIADHRQVVHGEGLLDTFA